MNPPTEPKPADTRYRAYRGGGWGDYDVAWVRSAVRGWCAPSNRYFSVGFRCALRGREPRV